MNCLSRIDPGRLVVTGGVVHVDRLQDTAFPDCVEWFETFVISIADSLTQMVKQRKKKQTDQNIFEVPIRGFRLTIGCNQSWNFK